MKEWLFVIGILFISFSSASSVDMFGGGNGQVLLTSSVGGIQFSPYSSIEDSRPIAQLGIIPLPEKRDVVTILTVTLLITMILFMLVMTFHEKTRNKVVVTLFGGKKK